MPTTQTAARLAARTMELDGPSSHAIDVRLFTIPGSHPGVAVQRMVDPQGIHYKRNDPPAGGGWGGAWPRPAQQRRPPRHARGQAGPRARPPSPPAAEGR